MLFTFCRSAEDSATLQSLNCDGFSIEVSWEDVYLAKKSRFDLLPLSSFLKLQSFLFLLVNNSVFSFFPLS